MHIILEVTKCCRIKHADSGARQHGQAHALAASHGVAAHSHDASHGSWTSPLVSYLFPASHSFFKTSNVSRLFVVTQTVYLSTYM